MAERSLEQLVSGFLADIEGTPHYARKLVGLAELVLAKQDTLKAFELACKALDAAAGDAEAEARAGWILGSLLSGYHLPMMNDARRNAAWDQVLRRAIRPGMHVLEVGTGGGMLAMMAARAGATRVTTCEKDPIVARVAQEICEHNGFGSVINVIPKSLSDLRMGLDLERPADLLVCDLFGNSLLDFDPLPVVADARARLLAPGAPVVPAAASVVVALGSWGKYHVACRSDRAAGFDIGPFAKMRRRLVRLDIGDPELALCSPDTEALGFDLSLPSHPESGRFDLRLEASRDRTVEGIVQWIRLDLDADTVLQSRPEPGARFFTAPFLWPFAAPQHLRRGDGIDIVVEYSRKRLRILALC